jgi:hypothetical protein
MRIYSFTLKIADHEGKNLMGAYDDEAPDAANVDPLSCAQMDVASTAALTVDGAPAVLGGLLATSGTTLKPSFEPKDAADLEAPDRIPGQVQVRFPEVGATFIFAGDGTLWVSHSELHESYAFVRADIE